MHADLVKLLDLQAKDAAVAEAERRLGALREETGVLDQALERARAVLEAARRAAVDAARRRDELEARIESYRVLQDRRQQRLEHVRNPKEASTLMAELDLARSVLAKEEAEFMRSGDAVTEAERRAAEAENAVQQLREAQAPQRETIAGKREAILAARERAVSDRERASAAVGANYLAKYERIRRGKAPLALYALHGDACGHCFTAVPTQRRAIIQRGETIEGCEACGVLLYSKG